MRNFQKTSAVAIGAFALVGALSACGGGDSGVKAGADATVTVDGKALELDSKTVACTETDGQVAIAVGAQDAKSGVGAILSTGDSPTVNSVALGSVNGVSLAWVKGLPGTQPTAKKDGKTYTITGEAQGVDISKPLEAPVTKSFEIKATCP